MSKSIAERAREALPCDRFGSCKDDWHPQVCPASLRPAVEAALRKLLEDAAMLHESIDNSCDHERQRGDPGAGAMAAVIEYRDKIRRLGEP